MIFNFFQFEIFLELWCPSSTLAVPQISRVQKSHKNTHKIDCTLGVLALSHSLELKSVIKGYIVYRIGVQREYKRGYRDLLGFLGYMPFLAGVIR
jgi:hypothetical protein